LLLVIFTVDFVIRRKKKVKGEKSLGFWTAEEEERRCI
jgi:hypothetical protein